MNLPEFKPKKINRYENVKKDRFFYSIKRDQMIQKLKNQKKYKISTQKLEKHFNNLNETYEPKHKFTKRYNKK